MNTKTLGSLQRVPLRTVWPEEDGHFTPWLCHEANLYSLGLALGLVLKFRSREKGVGSFRADIECAERDSGLAVVIENQFERTDHRHLGEVLTYAAGLNAKIVLWIAEEFSPEHGKALNWL